MNVRAKILEYVKPPPVAVSHAEYSMVFSQHDEVSQPTKRLIDLALAAASGARDYDLREVSARLPSAPYFPDIWPGEHYRFLAAMIKLLDPKQVVEIGTFAGLSAISMLHAMPAGTHLDTFDVVPWDQISSTVLRAQDFEDGRLVQHVSDLQDAKAAQQHAVVLRNADFLFIDAAKDGVMEAVFLQRFAEIGLKPGAILCFDDIRMWKMLKTWREIRQPKLDVTSFAHWSGTGLVEWPA